MTAYTNNLLLRVTGNWNWPRTEDESGSGVDAGIRQVRGRSIRQQGIEGTVEDQKKATTAITQFQPPGTVELAQIMSGGQK